MIKFWCRSGSPCRLPNRTGYYSTNYESILMNLLLFSMYQSIVTLLVGILEYNGEIKCDMITLCTQSQYTVFQVASLGLVPMCWSHCCTLVSGMRYHLYLSTAQGSLVNRLHDGNTVLLVMVVQGWSMCC